VFRNELRERNLPFMPSSFYSPNPQIFRACRCVVRVNGSCLTARRTTTGCPHRDCETRHETASTIWREPSTTAVPQLCQSQSLFQSRHTRSNALFKWPTTFITAYNDSDMIFKTMICAKEPAHHYFGCASLSCGRSAHDIHSKLPQVSAGQQPVSHH
jgi:hypothetical protein